MAPKHYPVPLSGGDRKALANELGMARAMTTILATRSGESRTKGEALIRTADKLICESWNERMWADGEPLDPPTAIDQAINGGQAPTSHVPEGTIGGARGTGIEPSPGAERSLRRSRPPAAPPELPPGADVQEKVESWRMLQRRIAP